MSRTINGLLVKDALDMAISRRPTQNAVLVHSDQGSQYTANAYHEQLNAHGFISSMSRKGECHDNAVVESFFHSLKTELIYNKVYKSRAEAKHQ